MVDFNSEGMLSANKSHILELIILGRRDELINTLQLWNEHKLEQNSLADKTKSKVRAVMRSVFYELVKTLERKLDKDDYKKLKYKCTTYENISDTELEEAFLQINSILDELNLIRIDNKKQYDATNIEAENEEKGL